MSSKLKMPLLFLTLLATSACVPGLIGPAEAPTVVSDYCRIAQPISYDSTIDSAETVAAIEAHNSKWACVCEKDCPKREAK